MKKDCPDAVPYSLLPIFYFKRRQQIGVCIREKPGAVAKNEYAIDQSIVALAAANKVINYHCILPKE